MQWAEGASMKSFFIGIWVKIKMFLNFFGLIDDKGQLSRTNLLVYIFTLKFAVVPMESASVHDMAMALAALGVYMGKKVVSAYVDGKSAQSDSTTSDVMDRLRMLGDPEAEED
jgi:hypothetical protein